MPLFNLSDRALANILAALRHWQRDVDSQDRDNGVHFSPAAMPYDDWEIDEICEALASGTLLETTEADVARAAAETLARIQAARPPNFMGIRAGDWVTYKDRDGKARRRPAQHLLCFSDHVVLRGPRAHGNPIVCNASNYLFHERAK